ncbi:MAG: efflux RND transporter periplasmic adaptor subunit [Clostridiales bacterium]|jgi:HlyD family secretion protein|nr:efflux RND transporter periplasmic adaptor subunit [Clostridiales bacterium]MDR2751835.1 efflux RND transporter periplasmic adaptor subunit [Clostridiales bacterium]
MKGNSGIRKVVKPIITLVVIGAVGYGGYVGYQWYRDRQAVQASANAESNAPRTELAAKADISEIVSAAGVVALRDEINVYSETSEKVAEVLVEVGDRVEEGQIIVIYDVEDKRESLQKQINQAEINLSNQELTLRSMVAPAASSTLKSLQNSVKNVERQIVDANNNLASTEIRIADQKEAIAKAEETLADAVKASEESALFLEAGGIAQTDHDKTVDAIKSAENAVTSAKNALRDLERTLETNNRSIALAEEDLEKAKGDLADANVVLKDESEKINYEKQQNQIKLTQLDLTDARESLSDIQESAASPISGTITSVNVAKGKSVDTSTILVTIADFTDLIVKADISEYDVPKLKLGQSTDMTSDGLEGMLYTGALTKISDSAVTTGAGTVVPVEFSINEIDGLLKPGFNLDLDITTAQSKDTVSVPIVAVQKDQVTGTHYVYTVDTERNLKKTDIKLGLTGDMIVGIASGLIEGEEIISSPTSNMFDGMPLAGYIRENQLGGGLFEMFGNDGGGARQAAPATTGSFRGGTGGNATFTRP